MECGFVECVFEECGFEGCKFEEIVRLGSELGAGKQWAGFSNMPGKFAMAPGSLGVDRRTRLLGMTHSAEPKAGMETYMLKEVYMTEETPVLVPVSEDWEQVAKCTQVRGLALEASLTFDSAVLVIFASEGSLDRPGFPVASLRSPAAPSAGDSAESAVSAVKGTDT